MSLDALASIFSGANQTGTVNAVAVGHSNRYALLRKSTLEGAGLSDTISSVRVFGSSVCDPKLVLFSSLNPFISFGDFNASFVQFCNAGNTEQNVNIPNLFNNRATSGLLIASNRPNEFRVSFRDMFLEQWRSIIDARLSDGAQRDGDPFLTWEMFPVGIDHLSPDRFYLKIHQNLNIVLDWWPDYEASLTYHVRLFPSGSNLRASVDRWAYWIEDGMKADDIEEKLRPAVIAGADSLAAELQTQLRALDVLDVEDVYLLPGRQLEAPTTGTITSSTFGDVTIALQLG